MKEQLIEFETAKLAKEKGFNNGSRNTYHENGEYTMTSNSFFRDNGSSLLFNERGFLEAPTQSLLQKWLREEERIMVWCEPVSKSNTDKVLWTVKLINWSKTNDTIDLKLNLLYEEALEKGLIEALKLIKL